MSSGERYCLLVSSSGLPMFYPNLYVTTQVRNRSQSYSAMESALSGISVLHRFLDESGEDLEERFRKGRFLEDAELDAIRDFCQLSFRRSSRAGSSASVVPLKGKQKAAEHVSAETEYVRLTVIAKYLRWMAELIAGPSADKATTLNIARMERVLKSRRPIKKNRNAETKVKGLTDEQLDILFELFRPESEFNPFSERSVAVRNRLIFLLLYHLGIRGGELLNIRIRDFDFASNQLVIARRADDKDDPRTDQPLVKTLDRRLPLKDTLAKEIHDYILNDRRNVRNAGKNDFLLITHKAGPTQGQPLSKSAYKKIMAVVRSVSPSLYKFTGHQLRHTWNEKFSDQMDAMDDPPDEEQQEKIRSYLMGWREGSGTGATYNKRFVRKKANEAAMALQEGMTRVPDGIKDE